MPAEHERSNARLLRENFLEKCQVGEFIPLFCGQTDEVALRIPPPVCRNIACRWMCVWWAWEQTGILPAFRRPGNWLPVWTPITRQP
ncbi:MAG: hypothetical protein R3E89_16885 [Thiolinea sp.]